VNEAKYAAVSAGIYIWCLEKIQHNFKTLHQTFLGTSRVEIRGCSELELMYAIKIEKRTGFP
jgi:hypothetical protein